MENIISIKVTQRQLFFIGYNSKRMIHQSWLTDQCWLIWLVVGRLTTPFSTKTGNTGDKVLGGNIDPPG